MSLLERSSSVSVLPPVRYKGPSFYPLPYPHAHALRRVSSVPNALDKDHYLNTAYIRSPFRIPYYTYGGEFGDYLRDKVYFGDREIRPPYSTWPVHNYMHLDPARSICSSASCWSEARRAPTYSRDQAWYTRGYRYDRPVLREYRAWVDPIPSGQDWKAYAYSKKPSTDSFLYNHWLAPYKYEAKLAVDYRQPYEYRYNYYIRPHIYYHFYA